MELKMFSQLINLKWLLMLFMYYNCKFLLIGVYRIESQTWHITSLLLNLTEWEINEIFNDVYVV